METMDGAATSGDPTQAAVGLDFKETMNNFKIMFPTLDDDVIEAVLRSNKGSIDPTVDQLLTMSNDCRTDFEPSGSMSCDDGGLPDAKPQRAFFNPM